MFFGFSPLYVMFGEKVCATLLIGAWGNDKAGLWRDHIVLQSPVLSGHRRGARAESSTARRHLRQRQRLEGGGCVVVQHGSLVEPYRISPRVGKSNFFPSPFFVS